MTPTNSASIGNTSAGRAGLLFRDRVAGAEAEEAGQHGEILVEGEHRKYRGEPADQHQFQQQAEHRHQHDRPDLGPGAQLGVIGFERSRPSARPGAPAVRRASPSRTTPPSASPSAIRTRPAASSAAPTSGRIIRAVDRNRRVDEQQAAQRQAEDANQAAIGIVGSIDHEPDRERL